jgi:hypothetical protein
MTPVMFYEDEAYWDSDIGREAPRPAPSLVVRTGILIAHPCGHTFNQPPEVREAALAFQSGVACRIESAFSRADGKEIIEIIRHAESVTDAFLFHCVSDNRSRAPEFRASEISIISFIVGNVPASLRQMMQHPKINAYEDGSSLEFALAIADRHYVPLLPRAETRQKPNRKLIPGLVL